MAGGGNLNGEEDDAIPLYFTWIKGGIRNIQLDIVGFLAILGEGSVLSNSQVASLSNWSYLPRLMPAPQALLRPSRPEKLEPAVGYTTAVVAGNYRSYINHIGNILADAEHYPPFSVRCVSITRNHGESGNRKQSEDAKNTVYKKNVTSKAFGPLWYLHIIGCFMSIVILSVSIWRKDGMALIAVLLLSLLSTLVGYGNKWKLDLPKRTAQNHWTPPGNVVIRYAKGNFLVVECNEDTARELYFAPENIEYLLKEAWQYRLLSLVGTMMLMFGVICLANSTTYLQISFAGAYLIMNALYWLVAALPQRLHWDTSCFEVKEQCIALANAKLPEKYKGRKKYVDLNSTFTQALWKAIVLTKEVDWVHKSAAAPSHPAWNDWLVKAQRKAAEATSRIEIVNGKEVVVWELPDWDPQTELIQCLKLHKEEQTTNQQA